jgi:deoxyribonuclease-4
MSIAGGLPRAVERAAIHGCESLQIFTKSAGQWRARPLPDEEVAEFRRRADKAGIHPVVAHASYLINLAALDEGLRRQSMESLAEELDRAETLGLHGLVLHPGACTGGSDEEGLARVAASLGDVLKRRPRQRARVLLEHTAGQGTSLGRTFEQIAHVLTGVRGHRRVGVWLDTCHLLAAGYDIASAEGYRDTFAYFEALIGLDRLHGFHVNDSTHPLGSRIDRHAHIGKGHLGLATFARLLRDPRFAALPMIIETEKTESGSKTRVQVDRLDEMNLATLRRLCTEGAPTAPGPLDRPDL